MLASGSALRGRPSPEATRPAERPRSRRRPSVPALLRRIPRLPRDSPRLGESSREIREYRLRHPRRGDAVQMSSSRVRSIVVGHGRRRQFGRGKLDEETGTDRKIVFDVDAAAMLSHDAGGDGQAESGAAVLGREMRQEKFVLIFRRYASAGVRDANLHSLRIGMGFGRDQDFPECGVLQSFRGIVDEIDNHAAKQRAVSAYRRQILGQHGLQRDPVAPPGEYFHRLMGYGVGIDWQKFGGRDARVVRALFQESREGGDLLLDQTRTLLDQLG